MSEENNSTGSDNGSGGDSTYQVFARKYRPRTFEEVLGQDHVIQTLQNAIEQNRLAHAYLFVGPRGTGKTTTARILAKALNCPGGPSAEFDPDDPICLEIAEGNSLDVLEIDGASNNGVEQVRDLRDTVKFAPASGSFKIYYIDEVHMLTTAAFNALLKTLEEPPSHVKFIFATTEPQKILPTIISRCQRFDLRRIPTGIISDHLKSIANKEGIALSDAAAFAIAKGADGGMRDAQSMLDQLVAFCGESIEESDVLEIFGFNSAESIAEMADLILQQNNGSALEKIHLHSEAGRDLGRLLGDLISHFRHVLVLNVDSDSADGELPAEIRELLEKQAQQIDTNKLLRLIDLLAESDARMKWSPNKKLHLEIAVIKAIQALGEASLDEVIAMVSAATSAAEKAEASNPSPGESLPPPGGTSVGKSDAADSIPSAAEPTQENAAISNPAEPEKTEPSTSTETVEPAPAQQQSAPVSADGNAPQGEALWDASREFLIKERPVIEMWLEAACFLDHSPGAMTIGFSSEQRFYRESLKRHEDFISETLSQVAGQKTELQVEVRDDIAPLAIVEESDEPSNGSENSDPEQNSQSDTTAAAAEQNHPAGDSATEEEQSQQEEKENFHDDPFIKSALEKFKARVIDPVAAEPKNGKK